MLSVVAVTDYRADLPESFRLSIYGPEDLEHLAQELDDRLRKTLGWDTPAERFV
ncbi:hypothetical protein ACW9HK_11560 [Nocardia gipuzkoensis]|uniref:hypothetical protein n=1 Tax=Nocardia gipuzkoensis TaxID=2749991 RepID=UPI002455253F|nr:hypothetical protein [Nocardia gipuzkoensis]